VRQARVEVAGERVSEMGSGLLALVGVAGDDDEADARTLAEKIVGLRIFEDAGGKMNRCLAEEGGTLGVVSQFTVLADCTKGRRPSFGRAAAPELAESLLESLVENARGLGVAVVTGRFRTTMEVSLTNHGPVTVLLDTKSRL
jgi:D-tyrosyl-tRNA(Tyr) deacylase